MTARAQFLLFAGLQVLDLASTVWFLQHGVSEANPAVRAVLHLANESRAALAAPKLLAMGLAWYGWRSGRGRLQGRVNLFYSACLVWNVVAVLSRGS